MVYRRIHRGENERGLRQPRGERGCEQERILIALVLVEVVLRQGDRAESADICLERQVGQAIDERKFVSFVLDTGAEVHAEFHVSASRPFFMSNRGQPRLLPQVAARR